MIPQLDTPELVHNAMLRGDISPINMQQCANVHGYQMMQAFDPFDEMWHDITSAMSVLWDFKGPTITQRAQGAVDHIEWLRRELAISRYNEKAAHAVLQQDHAELLALRSKMRYAKIFMEANDPHNARFLFGETQGEADAQEARQASGPSSPEQKCEEG